MLFVHSSAGSSQSWAPWAGKPSGRIASSLERRPSEHPSSVVDSIDRLAAAAVAVVVLVHLVYHSTDQSCWQKVNKLNITHRKSKV